MTLVWVLSVGAMLVTVSAVLIGRLLSRTRSDQAAAEWLRDFSIEDYRPMERLLRESDYEFLASQRGFHPRIACELRADRRKIFHGYLAAMIRDFNTLSRMARLFAVYASEDRSDFLRAIFWMKMRFYCLVLDTELRLALAPLPVGRIDIRGLVGQIDALRQNLEQLSLRHDSV